MIEPLFALNKILCPICAENLILKDNLIKCKKCNYSIKQFAFKLNPKDLKQYQEKTFDDYCKSLSR